MKYFTKLPLTYYNGYTVRNLLARARFTRESVKASRTFYPYTVKGHDRVDTIADDYYDNPDYSWLVWMANDVVDPYVDMGMTDDDFNRHIVKKYGSIELAQRKISHYRTDDDDDITEISVSAYTALAANLKKYYKPIIDFNGTVVSYARNNNFTTVTTNKIVQLDVNAASGTFTVGEEIGSNSTVYAFVVSANSSQVIAQHVTGTIAANTTITGAESGATANVTLNTTLRLNIPADEAIYWAPVTLFDVEEEKLAQDKEIILIDASQAGKISGDLTNLLRKN